MLEFIDFNVYDNDIFKHDYWKNAHAANRHHDYERYSEAKQSILEALYHIEKSEALTHIDKPEQRYACWYNLAVICLKANKLEEAKGWLDHACHYIPQPYTIYARLMSVYGRYYFKMSTLVQPFESRMAMLEQALQYYTRSLNELEKRSKPETFMLNSCNYLGIGLYYYSLGQIDPENYYKAAHYYHIALYEAAHFHGMDNKAYRELYAEAHAHSDMLATAREYNPIHAVLNLMHTKNWHDHRPELLPVERFHYHRELTARKNRHPKKPKPLLHRGINAFGKWLKGSKEQETEALAFIPTILAAPTLQDYCDVNQAQVVSPPTCCARGSVFFPQIPPMHLPFVHIEECQLPSDIPAPPSIIPCIAPALPTFVHIEECDQSLFEVPAPPSIIPCIAPALPINLVACRLTR